MKKIMFFAAIACMAIVSCSKQELNPNDNSGAISFSTYAGRTVNNTKAVMDLTELQTTGFGVLAFYTAATDYDGTTLPNFMYNESVTYSSASSTWSYSPIKYWPNVTTDKVSFLAYAPYKASSDATNISLSANTSDGNPTITFNQNMAAPIDLVVAKKLNQSNQSTKVDLNFRHILSRVNFEAYADADEITTDSSSVIITAISVPTLTNFCTSGVFTFNDFDAASAGIGAWTTRNDGTALDAAIFNFSNITFGNTFTSGIRLPVDADKTHVSLLKTDDYLYLIPGAGTTGATYPLAVTYSIVTLDSKLSTGYSETIATRTVDIPANTLVMGTAYKFTFKIGLNSVTLEATTVEDWGTEGNTNLGE